VRRNIAATIGPSELAAGLLIDRDIWDQLFSSAASVDGSNDDIAPYWVFDRGPAKIERLVPIMPFSSEAVRLPQLRKTLAAYRLAFGQPRQEELIEFLGADRDDAELLALASQLRIDLTPPALGRWQTADPDSSSDQLPSVGMRGEGQRRSTAPITSRRRTPTGNGPARPADPPGRDEKRAARNTTAGPNGLTAKPRPRRRAAMATPTRDRQRRWTVKSTRDLMVAPPGSGYHWMLTDDNGQIVGVQTWFGDGRWAYGPVKIAKASPGKVAELLRAAVDNPVPPLMGAREAASALGVSQSNLRVLSGLPKPVQVLAMGSVWRAQDIIDFKARREATPPKPGPKPKPLVQPK
jgi:hypothetical protein